MQSGATSRHYNLFHKRLAVVARALPKPFPGKQLLQLALRFFRVRNGNTRHCDDVLLVFAQVSPELSYVSFLRGY